MDKDYLLNSSGMSLNIYIETFFSVPRGNNLVWDTEMSLIMFSNLTPGI